MNRKMTSMAGIAAGALALTGAAMGSALAQGAGNIRISDLETALSTTGWDIVHRATGRDGQVAIGARSRDGWPVIHTLTGCDEGVCSGWIQETPLAAGFVETAVAYDKLPAAMTNRIGKSVMAVPGESGAVSLRGAVVGISCGMSCQIGAIESFASATRVSYDGLTGATADRDPRAAFWTHEAFGMAAPVPMDHRQIAAIVGQTERAAEGSNAPTRSTARTMMPAAMTGTISFPPLLPE